MNATAIELLHIIALLMSENAALRHEDVMRRTFTTDDMERGGRLGPTAEMLPGRAIAIELQS